jgi:hypothetical protein
MGEVFVLVLPAGQVMAVALIAAALLERSASRDGLATAHTAERQLSTL